RLYSLPGSHYVEPQFSWKYALAPSPIGFVNGNALGTEYSGNLFVGASRTTLFGGFLFRFKLSNDRSSLAFDDSRLQDKVADNLDKFDVTESESILIGKNFGIATDIQTGPDGNLYVVSLSNGAVYRISGKQPTLYVATLTGAQETPPNNSTATGTATLLLSPDEKEARLAVNFSGMSSAQTGAHIHGPGAAGVAAPILFHLPNGNFNDVVVSLSATDVQNLKNGLLYINLHSSNSPSGEIRGQFGASASASSFQFNSTSFSVSEKTANATITVTRIGNTTTAATVNYSATNGTATSPADYSSSNGTISFAAGETVKTFSISISDDLFIEGSETITVTLTNPSSGTFLGSPNTATLTISDDDIANTSPPVLRLDSSGPDANQAAAFDSLLLLRDPFPKQSIAPWLDLGSDPNTRVLIFVTNLSLNVGETVTVNLVDANSQNFDVVAEDVRVVPNSDVAQIRFRLPDAVATGLCTVKVRKGIGPFSNTGTFRIAP
ncbi:MAG TPA: CHRD domain-containing protein, partial [Pyrinomonadaceae bacterium]|nr:CHRD domain-containing protein [Pyrinomonadaceae bacterium]